MRDIATILPKVAPQAPAAAEPDYSSALPPWLNYLVAAFPTANLATFTFAVMEDAFKDESPAIMKAATRAAALDKKFFPTVGELNYYVRKEREKGEGEQWKLPPVDYYRRMSAMWPVCPDCGERVNPEWVNCPACIDMAAMAGGR